MYFSLSSVNALRHRCQPSRHRHERFMPSNALRDRAAGQPTDPACMRGAGGYRDYAANLAVGMTHAAGEASWHEEIAALSYCEGTTARRNTADWLRSRFALVRPHWQPRFAPVRPCASFARFHT
jgi:hypothetical protein